MGVITTEAWVLYSADRQPGRTSLVNESFSFSDISSNDVLAHPIYGCLEGNMLHAVQRDPIDICAERSEEPVVIGNSGVVRVERVGSNVKSIQPGDICIVFGNGVWDEQGYPIKIMGYDAPETMGVLAKKMKLHEKQLIPVAESSPFSLQQWAAFSLRYISAWANWRVAYECWKSQMKDVPPEETVVCAWGGGVSYAQLTLAKHFGCRVIMACSHPDRLAVLENAGIEAIDRAQFAENDFEQGFLEAIAEKTYGRGVSIFVDNIGTAVHRITLKALGRQGVITTCGWKTGMRTLVTRAIECISRHIHVHTHYAKYSEGVDAVRFAHEHNWIPPHEDRVWSWEEIPILFSEYEKGNITTYFPIFAVNGSNADER